jgi:GxxExxY protein
MKKMELCQLTDMLIGICIKIHTKIGSACFEKVYEEILFYELTKLKLTTERQRLLCIQYEELYVRDAYRFDLLVEGRLLIEVKSVHPLHPVHFNQVHSYLSLLNLKHGIIINFKVSKMKDGIHRVFNNSGKEHIQI